MSKIDLGPRREPYGDHEPKDDGWYGPFHDRDFALRVFAKLRRQQKYKGKPSLLMGIGDFTEWLTVPATVVEEAIRRSDGFSRYANAKVTTVWWFKLNTRVSRVSAWPMKHSDFSLNAENNWGEEE